jgi:hypothetical protein
MILKYGVYLACLMEIQKIMPDLKEYGSKSMDL